VVEPIDGTRRFITGWPLFGMLLALVWRGRPLFGQIDMPMLNERWVGWSGCATLFNGEEVRSSGCTRRQGAKLCTASPDGFSAEEWRMFKAVRSHPRPRRARLALPPGRPAARQTSMP
jgi:inositol-phosphate phosphatase / L-galactose 1-phosphate phosphatase / histidinol-phosphatase